MQTRLSQRSSDCDTKSNGFKFNQAKIQKSKLVIVISKNPITRADNTARTIRPPLAIKASRFAVSGNSK
jgi:hypothetical protein